MKRLCFGTLLNLIYQARGQNVTYKSICDAVFSVYGCDDTSNRDKSLPSHLKSGHDNVPPDVVDAARNTAYEDSVRGFDENVVGLIADANAKQFIYAIRRFLGMTVFLMILLLEMFPDLRRKTFSNLTNS